MTTSLQRCRNIWGSVEVRDGEPALDLHRNVIMLPCAPNVGLVDDNGWGAYDVSGKLIDAAALRIGAGFGLVGQSEEIHNLDLPQLPRISSAGYVYGGAINMHYGHFICSTLARLWWLTKRAEDEAKLVFHSPSDLNADYETDFVSVCFHRLGIEKKNIIIVQNPCIFNEITIPAPAFLEQAFVYKSYRDICHQIGRPDWDSQTQSDQKLPPAYISKTQLGVSVERVSNEKVIEDVMAQRGAEIVYPEQISFCEQVRLFSQRRVIAGIVGSAFHTSIFAPPVSKIVCLAPRGQINANMALMDAINGTDAAYHAPIMGLRYSTGGLAIRNLIELNNIEDVARDFADEVFKQADEF